MDGMEIGMKYLAKAWWVKDFGFREVEAWLFYGTGWPAGSSGSDGYRLDDVGDNPSRAMRHKGSFSSFFTSLWVEW